MSTRTPRVSIGLPVYNGEPYLRAAMESVLGQTFGDLELIVLDNASTDGTEDLCRSYAATDPRVRYIRRPVNVGVTRNFNEVVDEARAPYFKWQSADDLNAPDLIARCVDVLDGDAGVVLVHSYHRFIGPEGQTLPEDDRGIHLVNDAPHERLRTLWTHLRFCNAQYGLMRVAALRRTPLFRSFIGSDISLLEELSLHGKFVELPEYLLFRRLHKQAASSMNGDQLLEHYGLQAGSLVLYYWRHLLENVLITMRAPLGMGERGKVVRQIVRRAITQRRVLATEVGFVALHALGLPHPVIAGTPMPQNQPTKSNKLFTAL
jgi:glycosyltransferase involved in cell wall biosynthesis